MLTQVRLGGLGGQGVVLAGSILGEAATHCGRNAAGSNSYGAAARGTACRSDVVLSDQPIDYPHLASADVLGVLSQAAYDKFLPSVAPAGLVFYDDFSVKPRAGAPQTHHPVPATAEAVRLSGNRQGGNIILLGAIVGALDLLPAEAVREAVRRSVRERFLAANLKALDLGLEIGLRLRGAPGSP